MRSLGTKGMARLAKEARFYGGGKGGYKGAPDAQYGSAGKGDYGFGGKGGGKGDMGYGSPPGMDMYGGKGGKGDMYGGKGGKGDMGYGPPPGMDMYGGKGGGKGDMYGAPPGMDMYGGKGGGKGDMYGGKGGGKGDMYGGKGGKGDMGYGAPPGMDMYGGKGGGKGDMYGGKGGKGDMGGPPQGMSVGVPPATARIPASSLKLDFPYPAGQVPEMGMFDVRDEVCKSMGFLHGQKLRVTNPQNPSEMFEMVVVGAARDPEVGDVAMWFHIAGEPGAGMFHVEMLDAYREFMQVVGKVQLNPLTAEEQKQLAEHGKLVRRMQLNEMNIECFHSWRMAKTLKKMWQPAKIDGAPFPPQCDFGYPMSTGVKPEESKEKGEPVNCYATFDKRQEVLNLFEIDGVKLSHGVTIVVPEKGKETREWVVIGSRPMPGVRYVLWAHPAGDPGARPISLRKLKKATLKNAPPTAIVEDKKENYEHAEDDIDVSQLLAFERFVARAERAVVRKVKKNKGKKGDSKKEAKKEEAKEEEPKKQ